MYMTSLLFKSCLIFVFRGWGACNKKEKSLVIVGCADEMYIWVIYSELINIYHLWIINQNMKRISRIYPIYFSFQLVFYIWFMFFYMKLNFSFRQLQGNYLYVLKLNIKTILNSIYTSDELIIDYYFQFFVFSKLLFQFINDTLYFC